VYFNQDQWSTTGINRLLKHLAATSKFLVPKVGHEKKFHIEDLQIQGITNQSSAAWVTWHAGLCTTEV
jgi:hypothetical protein